MQRKISKEVKAGRMLGGRGWSRLFIVISHFKRPTGTSEFISEEFLNVKVGARTRVISEAPF